MNKQFLVITTLILLAALSRLLPHAPNFSPIAAMALFGGAWIGKKWLAFLVPMASLLLSDLLISGPDLYAGFWIQYACFALFVTLGFTLRHHKGILRVGGLTLTSSVLFYLVTNFGDWALLEMYPKDMSGLVACYTAAIPFFRNTVMGDLFYSAVLFGGFYLLQLNVPALSKERVQS